MYAWLLEMLMYVFSKGCSPLACVPSQPRWRKVIDQGGKYIREDIPVRSAIPSIDLDSGQQSQNQEGCQLRAGGLAS
jgi:hypothetical protein